MTLTPPSNDELAAIADRYRLGLSPQDIEQYQVLISGALTSYDVVERRYSERLPEPPARAWQRPDAAADDLGAWYVTSEITKPPPARSPGAASRSRTTSRWPGSR